MDEPVKKCKQGIRTGEEHGMAKLTDHEVELFRRMVESGEFTQQQAAEKFDISKAHAHRLSHYKQR